jgi:hypothetical protein
MSTVATTIQPTTRPGTLLLRTTPDAPLVLAARRRRATALARLRAFALDRRLAAGQAPESGCLLATRATLPTLLVAPKARHRLADAWEDLLRRASEQQAPIDPRVPIARDAVRASATGIRALAAALRTDAPVPAQAVARASLLLTDGASPVYRRGTDLRDVIGRVTEALTS